MAKKENSLVGTFTLFPKYVTFNSTIWAVGNVKYLMDFGKLNRFDRYIRLKTDHQAKLTIQEDFWQEATVN